MKRVLRRTLILLLVGVILCCALRLRRETEDYRQGAALYAALRTAAPLPARAEGAETEALPWPEVDFPALLEENPDTVGWLYSPDTPIHYPVVQGTDNDFYLHHLFDGSAGRCGCIFLDAGNAGDFSDFHSVLYGHHMRDGSMFKSLKGYQDQSYYESHPTLLLLTPEHRYTLEVFAAYVADVDEDAWRLDFADAAQRRAWLEERQRRSVLTTDCHPRPRDRVLTLSTCSYERKNVRFVVHTLLRMVDNL